MSGAGCQELAGEMVAELRSGVDGVETEKMNAAAGTKAISLEEAQLVRIDEWVESEMDLMLKQLLAEEGKSNPA